MAFEDYWNEVHKKYSTGKPVYDNWLDKYSYVINSVKTKILDLGCGNGNDTLYLTEKGHKVLACDYSEVALNHVNENIPRVETQLVDISKRLPFDDKTTKQIMAEIKRVLSSHGVLLARVNSMEDLNHGAGQGEKIEDNFYFVEGYNKRFFRVEDAEKYFSIIGTSKVIEAEMLRYSKPKKVLEIEVKSTLKSV